MDNKLITLTDITKWGHRVQFKRQLCMFYQNNLKCAESINQRNTRCTSVKVLFVRGRICTMGIYA